jgi:hypothetical protein
MNAPTVIEQILDLARWAPSGDNEQRARFEIVAPDHVRIHCKDTRCWRRWRSPPAAMGCGPMSCGIRSACRSSCSTSA